MAIVSWFGGALIVILGFLYDTLFYGVVLFFFALGCVGAVQAVWGRNFLSKH